MLLSQCPMWLAIPLKVLASVGFVFSTSAVTLHGQTLNINDLVHEATASNPNLRVAERAAVIALNDLPLALALPEPRVNAVWYPYPVYTARGSQRGRLALEQTIPFPGIRKLRGAITQAEAESLTLLAEVMRADLALGVKLAYDELYHAQERGRLIHSFEEDLARFEEAALTQYEVGRETLSPVLSIQNERRALHLRDQQVKEQRLDALRQLAVLLDQPISFSSNTSVPERPLAPIETESVDDLKREALNARPALAALRKDKHRGELSVSLARREALPEFHFGLEYADIVSEAFLPNGDGRDVLGIKVGARLPLWRKARKAPVERVELELNQVEDRMRALSTSVTAAIDELIARLLSQQEQVALLEDDLLPRAELVRDTALSSYTTGRLSYLDVMDAERTLFTLRIQKLDTSIRLMLTHAHLERQLAR